MILRPGIGWRHIGGSIYEHKTGVRIHVGGLLVRLPNGEMVKPMDSFSDVYNYIDINGGNKKRGLMAWALNIKDAKHNGHLPKRRIENVEV